MVDLASMFVNFSQSTTLGVTVITDILIRVEFNLLTKRQQHLATLTQLAITVWSFSSLSDRNGHHSRTQNRF